MGALPPFLLCTGFSQIPGPLTRPLVDPSPRCIVSLDALGQLQKVLACHVPPAHPNRIEHLHTESLLVVILGFFTVQGFERQVNFDLQRIFNLRGVLVPCCGHRIAFLKQLLDLSPPLVDFLVQLAQLAVEMGRVLGHHLVRGPGQELVDERHLVLFLVRLKNTVRLVSIVEALLSPDKTLHLVAEGLLLLRGRVVFFLEEGLRVLALFCVALARRGQGFFLCRLNNLGQVVTENCRALFSVFEVLGQVLLFQHNQSVEVLLDLGQLVDCSPQASLLLSGASQLGKDLHWRLVLLLNNRFVCVKPEIRRYVQLKHVLVKIDALFLVGLVLGDLGPRVADLT